MTLDGLLSEDGSAHWPLATYPCLFLQPSPSVASATHHRVPSLSLPGLSLPPSQGWVNHVPWGQPPGRSPYETPIYELHTQIFVCSRIIPRLIHQDPLHCSMPFSTSEREPQPPASLQYTLLSTPSPSGCTLLKVFRDSWPCMEVGNRVFTAVAPVASVFLGWKKNAEKHKGK